MKKKCYIDFKTVNGNQYIYDSNTGCVIACDEIIKESIDLYEGNTIEDVEKILFKKYKNEKMVKRGLSFVEKYSRLFTGFYKTSEQVKREQQFIDRFDEQEVEICLFKLGYFGQIVLNLTENCNLRCKYCFFSESYDNTRNRTDKIMSEKTAIDALDYYFKEFKKVLMYNPGKKCVVTFYGGEPLLNFEIIKKCVEYTKENCPSEYIFSITSNGLLLQNEIAEYLVSNDFYISVSLDGNKNNHDRNRVLPNNKGSFDIIMNNLKSFKEKYPDYNRINIISVFDYKTNLLENNEFFKDEDLPRLSFVNAVLDKNTNYYKKFRKEDIEKFNAEYSEILKLFIGDMKNNSFSNEYADMFWNLNSALFFMRRMYKDYKVPILPYTGACVPGTKLSVRVDGTFDMCERVDYSMPIGNVYDGIDFKAIVNVMKKYNKKNVLKNVGIVLCIRHALFVILHYA